MKNGLVRYAPYFLYVFLWILAFCFSPQPISAQSADCSTTTERKDFPVYIYDQRASVRYGPSTCGTVNPGANISRVSGISSTSFSCGPHSDKSEVSRAFVATLFRCQPGTAVFDVTAPPGFTCNNAAWRYYPTSGGFGNVDLTQPILGTGCRVTVPYPPGEWESQAIVTINLPDPSFSAVCNGNGTATISWGSVSGATEYGWRLNNRANGWGNWATDSYGFSTGNSAVVPITNGESYEVNVTSTNFPGRHPFASSWSPAFTCSAPAATYPITYNGNGNTGGSIPAAQTKTNNVTLTLRTNTGSLTRTGYTFAGWNTAANGSGTNYAAGGSYTANAPATLYARWTPNTYPITYNGNGNTGGSIPAAQTKIHDVTLTLQGNTGSLSRTGYTFAGWNSAANGTGTNYAAGGTYTPNTAATLYARWTLNTYTVTGTRTSTNGTITPATRTVNHGSTTTFTITPNVGYTASASGCGGSLSGTTYTTGVITANCTVTATFTLNTYTVTGTRTSTNGTITPATRTVNHGATTTFTITPNVGYTASASGCGGSLSGTTYTTGVITANCTVTATFTLNTYTVTGSAGANGTITPATRTVNHGATTTFTITPNVGYTASASGCGGSLSGTTYTTGVITANCTVTATFTIMSFALTTNKSGTGTGTLTSNPAGINCGATCSTNYNYGTSVTLSHTAAANSLFTGWSGACTGTGACTVSMTQARNVTASFALMPDLVPETIDRDPPSTNSSASYTISYCNNGPGGASAQTFVIRITNTTNGIVITRTVTIPAVGAANCGTTTVPCSQLGDTFGGINCNENSVIDVTLDFGNTVSETDESNNTSAGNTFSAIASEPFYKLSNASLHRLKNIDVSMPVGIQPYDAADDTSDPFLIVKGGAGITSATSTIRILPGTGSVSTNNIRRDTYTDANTYLSALSTFTTYANAQKPTKVITDYNLIGSTIVNIYNGNLTINAAPTSGAEDYVLLVNGNVIINQSPTFNTVADNSIAIIATGSISINPPVTTVNAILIANSIDLGNSPINRLKINGNLITNSPTTITRNVPATTTPNLFVVFNPKMYLDLLPHLSDITVEGRQVQ